MRKALVIPAACLVLVVAGCGSSKKKTTASAAASTESTTSAVSAQSTTTTTSKRHTRTTKTHKSSTTSSTTTHASHTTHTTSTHATTSTTSTTATHTVSGLPSPEIERSNGSLRGWLHADNHAPKAGKAWSYEVLAADSSGHPLAGSTVTEFVFGGSVVGKETPATHTLKNGLLHDNITYPSRAIGIPLTFRIVLRTHLGSVTLDWSVKVHK
jgi:Ni/Co efflux regulator RcnB